MNQELELKLQAHFDGELPAGEAGEVTDLIASDAGARALLAELQNTRGVMASFEADVKLPESREFYWSKVERDIRHLQKPEPAAVSLFAQWRWWLIRFGAVAAMVLVFFAIGPRIGLTGPGIPEMETALADSEAFTYRDYQQGVTLVWLAYPAENEFADTDPVDTLN